MMDRVDMSSYRMHKPWMALANGAWTRMAVKDFFSFGVLVYPVIFGGCYVLIEISMGLGRLTSMN